MKNGNEKLRFKKKLEEELAKTQGKNIFIETEKFWCGNLKN